MTDRKLNLTMLCDFYELTMGNGYLEAGLKDRITYFDVFFRNVPDNGGFAVCAGLEQLVQYIQNLHFDEEDIAYLRGKGCALGRAYWAGILLLLGFGTVFSLFRPSFVTFCTAVFLLLLLTLWAYRTAMDDGKGLIRRH